MKTPAANTGQVDDSRGRSGNNPADANPGRTPISREFIDGRHNVIIENMTESTSYSGRSDDRGGPVRTPFLSIIIPAFNEEERLPETLGKISAYAETLSYPMEVIVVDSASTDRTAIIVKEFASRYPLFIRYLYEAVSGKGAAVRTGMLAGQGEYLLMSDADLAVPVEEVAKFLSPRLDDYDIAIGSREIKGAVRHNEPSYRHLMGRVFNLIVRLLVLPGLHDTQCGFKCFRRDIARDLFSASRITGWSFDVEVLCRAMEKGYRIMEIPVQWNYGQKSKVKPVVDTWNMLKEVIKIRSMLKGRQKVKGI